MSGSEDVAIVMTKADPYLNRKMYGSVLSRFCHQKTADKLCKELNQYKNEVLVKPYP